MKESKKSSSSEESYIRINRTRKTGEMSLRIMKFMDHGHYIAYLPELRLSGYGDTEIEAIEMLNHSAIDFVISLTKMSTRDMERELAKLGFMSGRFNHKTFKYGATYVDVNGVLQEFNLPADTQVEVEQMAV